MPLANRFANQLEPAALIDAFLAHPPQDFTAWQTQGGILAFAADFYLLTTLDDALRRRIDALPGRWWRRLLSPRTCFIGTTVSEYCLLPPATPPAGIIADIKQQLAPRYPFLIIKDLPQQSPLLTQADNVRAAALMGAARAAGFVIVDGQALAYVPIDFASIDDYLARLSNQRRKDLRRKLRMQDRIAVSVVRSGDALFADDAVIDEYYRLYTAVFAQSDTHFDLLTRPFFASVLRDAAAGGVVFLYHCDGELIGFNLCFIEGGNMIDKYVGFRYPVARELNLYFVSWFVNLAYALEHGLKHYVAGWSDPEVKRALGASFTFTCHAVHVRNPLLRALLKPFASLFERDAHVIGHADAGAGGDD
ncbi:MAG TPA: GNAT family N-acetyltransferase [Candidatus Acidoferrum sp.]|nr:GNAT family N-acetyltransferase [Candidatus Acidoferrum sp.]